MPSPQVVRFRLEHPLAAPPQPGTQHSLAISPDGSSLAFGTTNDIGTYGPLHIRELGTGSTVPLQTEGSFHFSRGTTSALHTVGTSSSGRFPFEEAVPSPRRTASLQRSAQQFGGPTTLLSLRTGERCFAGHLEEISALWPGPGKPRRSLLLLAIAIPGDHALVFAVVDSVKRRSTVPELPYRPKNWAAEDHRSGRHGPQGLTPRDPNLRESGGIYAVRFDVDRLEVLGSPVPVVDGIATEPLDGTAPYDVSQNGTLAFITGGPRSPNNRIVALDRQGRQFP